MELAPPWEQGQGQEGQAQWADYQHSSGVAVFKEAEGAVGDARAPGGAFMMSTSLRSTPKHAFEVGLCGQLGM